MGLTVFRYAWQFAWRKLEVMPELPEVETIARGLQKRVAGDVIESVWIGNKTNFLKSPAQAVARTLTGARIERVQREGKHLVIDLSRNAERASKRSSAVAQARNSQAQWIVHLGMTGRLLVTTPETPVERHTHARLAMASGRELRFVDPRKFGRLEFRDLGRRAAFEAPGAEPLTIGAQEFAALFRERRLCIKAALLNQTLLAGAGNIYADESLFQAGIRPRRRANRLTGAELERLRMALRQILRHAIRLGGSSVSDYVDADGSRGFFQFEHCVYQRTGEPCRRCQTPIRRVIVGGRGTHYCPTCQR